MNMTNIERICSDATQLVSKEFPDLTLIFIPYDYQKSDDAFKKHQDKIFRHPAADKLFQEYRNADIDSHSYKAIHIGPFGYNKFNFLNFKNGTKALAFVFVPIADLNDVKHNLAVLLSAAFPVIRAYTHNETYDALSRTDATDLDTARDTMLSDWYGALAASLIKGQSFLKALSKWRCHQTLTARYGETPELIPTPIGYDAASIIFEEAKKTPSHALKNTISLCQELSDIIPDYYIDKWKTFAEKAQILAWGDVARSDILGMAIHTSEDSEIKAIASIVSDIISRPPSLSTYAEQYNPFTEDEANERRHKNICKKDYRTLLPYFEKNRHIDLNEVLHEKNVKMLLQHPIGWSSASILTSIETFNPASDIDNDHLTEDEQRQLQDHFENAINLLPWKEIERFFLYIHQEKRKLTVFNVDNINAILDTHNFEHADFFKSIFKHYRNDYRDNLIFDYKQYYNNRIENASYSQ